LAAGFVFGTRGRRGGANRINAFQKRTETVALKAIKNVEAALLRPHDASLSKDGEVLRYGRKIVADKLSELANAKLSVHDCLRNKQP
jgi:hypothetical protein